MRKLLTCAVAVASWGMTPVAFGATCTVTGARSDVLNIGDGFGARVEINGTGIPVTIDEAAGTVQVDWTTIPPNALFQILSVANHVTWLTETSEGTIDAQGNVNFGSATNRTITSIAPDTPVDGTQDYATGFTGVTVVGSPYVVEGDSLDFATGRLKVTGLSVNPFAPGANFTTASGFTIECTLDAIPDPANLPQGPALAKVAAKGKLSGDPAVGDSLTLKAKWSAGARPTDMPNSDLIFRVKDGTGAIVMLIRVPHEAFAAKGKKVTVVDTDGTKIVPITRVKTGVISNGKLTIVTGKKSSTFVLKHTGLDLSALAAGEATVTFGVGHDKASKPVTVETGPKGVKIK